jgi:hypothetical protein
MLSNSMQSSVAKDLGMGGDPLGGLARLIVALMILIVLGGLLMLGVGVDPPKGGDRLGGLALLISILTILIVLGGLLLGVLLSRTLARRLGWSGAKLLLATLGLGAIGVGVLFVIANFREDIWAPPRLVTFNAAPGFTQNWVILLADRRSGSVQLVWDGVEMPFFGKKTVIDIPPSGIVRVRDLSGLRDSPRGFKVLWSDGSCNNGWSTGPAPRSTRATGATSYMAFSRVSADCGAHLHLPEDEALGAYIAAREPGPL